MSNEEYNGGDFVPMELRSGRETLVNMPNRVITLVWKLVSFQGIVLSLATWLVFRGRIESYAWLVVVMFVLFGRSALDFIKELKK